jgi:hypothetical protein
LNWQVQVAPLSLSITSLPDAWLAAPALDAAEALTSTVAISPNKVGNATLTKRFIDTLRFPAPKHPRPAEPVDPTGSRMLAGRMQDYLEKL